MITLLLLLGATHLMTGTTLTEVVIHAALVRKAGVVLTEQNPGEREHAGQQQLLRRACCPGEHRPTGAFWSHQQNARRRQCVSSPLI